MLDWSAGNQLAVCLSGHVYLWNSGSGDIQQLMEMDNTDDYVSSVSWVKEGNYLAIGTSTAQVQVRSNISCVIFLWQFSDFQSPIVNGLYPSVHLKIYNINIFNWHLGQY